MNLNVTVVDKVTNVEVKLFRTEKYGSITKVQAIPESKYILTEGQINVAPEMVIVKGVGKDLHISRQDTHGSEPQLIIENFFVYPGDLMGKGKDGNLHTFISSSGNQKNGDDFLLNDEGALWVLDTVDTGSALPVPELNVVTKTGPVSDKIESGTVTDAHPPMFTIQNQTGDTTEILGNSEVIGDTLIDKGSERALLSETGLTAGELKIVIKDQDLQANISEQYEDTKFEANLVAVGKASLSDVIDDVGSITDSIKHNDETDDTRPTFIGQAEANAVVEIYANGLMLGKAQTDKSGYWMFTPEVGEEMAEGEFDITLIAIDADGNKGPESEPFHFAIDITKPHNPGTPGTENGISDIIDNGGSGHVSVKPGDTTDDVTPVLSGGKQNPRDTITIIDNGDVIGTAIVKYDGTWEFTPASALSNDEHKFQIIVTDPAGNSSDVSDPYIITIDADTSNPDPAEDILLFDDVNVTGEIKSGDTTDDNTPTLSGKAEADCIVFIMNEGNIIGSEKVGKDGSWAFTPGKALNDGDYSFSTVVQDAAGNKSTESTPIDFTVDTSAVEIIITHAVDNVGTIEHLASADSTDDTTPTLHGTAKADSTLQIEYKDSSGNTQTGSTKVNADGSWSWEAPPLRDGDWEFRARNQGAWSKVFEIHIDTIAPLAPKITNAVDNEGAYDIDIRDGGRTDDSTPKLEGTGEPGTIAHVEYRDSASGRWIVDPNPVEVQFNGSWSWEAPELDDGAWEFRSRTIDQAGNVSPYSNSYDVVIMAGPFLEDFNTDAVQGMRYVGDTVDTGMLILTQTVTATIPGTGAGKGTGVIPSYQNGNGNVWGLSGAANASLKGIEASSISFNWRHAQAVETITFYDRAGNVIHTGQFGSKILLPLDGYSTFDMPNGRLFSSFTVSAGKIGGISPDWIEIDNILIVPGRSRMGAVDSLTDQSDDIMAGLASQSDAFIIGDSDEFLHNDTAFTGSDGASALNLTGADQTLTLSQVTDKLDSVEVIDITGTGDNTLTISIDDILTHGEAGLYIDDDKIQFMVKGDEGDVVNLDDLVEGSDASDWLSGGEVTVGGTIYQVYQHGDLEAELLVQQGVQTHLI